MGNTYGRSCRCCKTLNCMSIRSVPLGKRNLNISLNEGVSADPNKIRDMLDWPTPKDVKGMRRLKGLTRYYRKLWGIMGR